MIFDELDELILDECLRLSGGRLIFDTIAYHLAATAAKRPRLATTLAEPVAELLLPEKDEDVPRPEAAGSCVLLGELELEAAMRSARPPRAAAGGGDAGGETGV